MTNISESDIATFTYDHVINPYENYKKKIIVLRPRYEQQVNDELKRQGKSYIIDLTVNRRPLFSDNRPFAYNVIKV